MNPFQPVRDLEGAVCQYTGAPFCVAVNSCTAALMLAVAWHVWNRPVLAHGDPDRMSKEQIDRAIQRGRSLMPPMTVEIPKRTYVSVPQSIIHAGGRPTFRDEDWLGCYELRPLGIWDSARWFSENMWHAHRVQHTRPHDRHPRELMLCVSFHASKTLGHSQGGAILHCDPDADAWLRRARFDGRTEGVAPKDDTFTQLGWHCYLSPDVAAGLLLKLHSLPKHNDPLPNDDYPDLSTLPIFRGA